MSNIIKPDDTGTALSKPLYVPIKRRSFFMYAGATAGVTALALAGCNDDNNNNPNYIDVGAGDVGVLNYAYALEQLEAAFYAQVLTGGYFTAAGTPEAEKQIFRDLALHEKIHVDFFKQAISGANATPLKDLTPDFSSINFGERASVLNAAKTFEDLGVAAYNGAGQYIQNAAYLTIAGKIVSVEARHAALIRDLITFNSFVADDVVDFSLTSATARQEKSKSPTEVLNAANMYLADGSKLSASSLQ
ncbi:ferritin-like domain-containing protein [Hymenobacter aerilatus]|uniref:Ferritin-like domain-containing protein n=1 Tax=Hymenobacter aerilatus TaxID=2932251 RepID=A0A8T9T047_9BACT|nr:ferritin-like domain-containing protein [Hymenobacter aerilatus]UOR05476.1 ferritin-like domain-containing protein [Hymenobacter aerilatus]